LEGVRCVVAVLFFSYFFLLAGFELCDVFSVSTVIKISIISALILVLKFFLFASFHFVLGVEGVDAIVVVEEGAVGAGGRGFLLDFVLLGRRVVARGWRFEKFEVFAGGLLGLFFIFGRVGGGLSATDLLREVGS
jgi:hypothetical protein